VGVAFIGAGSYAQSNLLPNLPAKASWLSLKGVMTSSGATSKRVAERFGFAFCTEDEARLLGDPEINTVFVATRHDSHAGYVDRALRAGKRVFVEKPLCLHSEELENIEALFGELRRQGPAPQLMVGYNRRFAPHAEALKKELSDGPMAMIYRINAGAIPADSWIQDPEVGGGRILGEACHFIDFLTWLCGSLPVSVYASALPGASGVEDTVSIQLGFANGSVGTVCYFANGSRRVDKEYIEVYQSGLTGILRDFKALEIHGRQSRRSRHFNQDKGQQTMVRRFLEGARDGRPPLIAPEEIFAVMRACFAALASLRERKVVDC
jgi:polar amino acid transport system substrate-binding protein